MQNNYGELYSLSQQMERFMPDIWAELRCNSGIPGLYFSGASFFYFVLFSIILWRSLHVFLHQTEIFCAFFDPLIILRTSFAVVKLIKHFCCHSKYFIHCKQTDVSFIGLGQDILFCGVSSAFHNGLLTSSVFLEADLQKYLNEAVEAQQGVESKKIR